MARLIRADGTEAQVAPANGESFTLAEFQRFVGGYIELVPRLPGCTLAADELMFCNEDGLRLRLRPNAVASRLAAPHRIVGDVIVCSLTEAG